MVPAHSRKVSRVSRYSGSRLLFSSFVYEAFTLFGRLSQNRSTRLWNALCGPNPGELGSPVWALTLSLATTQVIDVSFSSSGYLDVSVPQVPPAWLCIHHAVTVVCTAGFPHSDISGSMAICASPKLFAACRVLHRLLVPRHPPYTLISLTCCFSSLLFLIN